MLLLALAGAAAAFTADRVGGYVDYGFGPAAGPAIGVQLGFGVWRGKYDEDLAFGRFWSVGLAVSQRLGPDPMRTAWAVEVRRGSDLIVGGVHGFASAGPLLVQKDEGALGLAARVGGAAELRRTPTLGFALRLEAGVDVVEGRVEPAGMLTLGVQSVFAPSEEK